MILQQYIPAMVMAACAHIALLQGSGLFSTDHDQVNASVTQPKFKLVDIEEIPDPIPPLDASEEPDEFKPSSIDAGATLAELYAREATSYKLYMQVDVTVARPANLDNRKLIAPMDNRSFDTKSGTQIDGGIIDSSRLSQSPETRFSTPPPYPFNERRLRHSGKVIALIIVNEKGNVIEARIEESTGEAFSESVRSTLMQWKFQPGMLDGKVVKFKMRVPFNFDLDRE